MAAGWGKGPWGAGPWGIDSGQVVAPASFASSSFGTAVFTASAQVYPVSLVNAQAWGTSEIFNRNRWVYPPGVAPTASRFGTAWISDRVRYLQPSGFYRAQTWGLPVAFNKNRWLYPSSIAPTNPRFGAVQAITTPWYFVVPTLGRLSNVGTLRISLRVQPALPSGWQSSVVGGSRIAFRGDVGATGWASSTFGAPAAYGNIFLVYGAGWVSSRMGAVGVIGPQTIAPGSIRGDVVGANGFVYNYNQVARHLNTQDDPKKDIFGQYTLVENRNRELGVFGWRTDRISNGAVVRATAWGIFASLGDTSTIPAPRISDRVRYYFIPGIDSFASSPWHNVRNAAIAYPMQGWANATQYGTHVVYNRSRQYNIPPGPESSRIGTAFIAYRVRSVQQLFPYSGSFFSVDLGVTNRNRQIFPLGWEEYQTSDTRFTLYKAQAFPSSIVPRDKQVGEQAVVENRNRTYTLTLGEQGDWGTARIELLRRFLQLQERGIEPGVFGQHVISDKRQWITGIPSANSGATVPTGHAVDYTSVTPFITRKIFAQSLPAIYGKDFGVAFVRTNVLYAEGVLTQVFGSGTEILNRNRVIYPPPTNATGLQKGIGTPSFRNGRRFVGPATGIAPPGLGKPAFSPHTIYATFNTPDQAAISQPGPAWRVVDSGTDASDGLNIWKWDKFGQNGGWWPPSSKFGRIFPWVDSFHRRLFVPTLDDGYSGPPPETVLTRYGRPVVSLEIRTVRPNNWRSSRFGPFTELRPRTDIAEMIGIPPDVVPSPVVTKGYSPSEPGTVGGLPSTTQISTKHRVELLNRTVTPAPFVSFFRQWIFEHGQEPFLLNPVQDTQPPSRGWVFYAGPPIPREMQGFLSEVFGDTLIGYRIRNVYPTGFIALDMRYRTLLPNNRMLVRNRDQTVQTERFPTQYVSVGSQTPFSSGVPGIYNRNSYVRPDCVCSDAVGVPHVS